MRDASESGAAKTTACSLAISHSLIPYLAGVRVVFSRFSRVASVILSEARLRKYCKAGRLHSRGLMPICRTSVLPDASYSTRKSHQSRTDAGERSRSDEIESDRAPAFCAHTPGLCDVGLPSRRLLEGSGGVESPVGDEDAPGFSSAERLGRSAAHGRVDTWFVCLGRGAAPADLWALSRFTPAF